MKTVMRVILSSILAFLGFGCSAQSDKQQPKIEMINPADLKPGPIQHEQLSEEQLQRIRKLHSTFAELNGQSLDQWIDNFKRDLNPDKEIAVWERIAKAYINYCSQKDLSLEYKEEVFKTLLIGSMYASDEEAIKSLNLKLLSKDEARKILNNY